MVSHAVCETWPSGLSYDKNLGLRPRFLSTESLEPCFSHGMGDHDQILQYRHLLSLIHRSLNAMTQIFKHQFRSEILWNHSLLITMLIILDAKINDISRFHLLI